MNISQGRFPLQSYTESLFGVFMTRNINRKHFKNSFSIVQYLNVVCPLQSYTESLFDVFVTRDLPRKHIKNSCLRKFDEYLSSSSNSGHLSLAILYWITVLTTNLTHEPIRNYSSIKFDEYFSSYRSSVLFIPCHLILHHCSVYSITH